MSTNDANSPPDVDRSSSENEDPTDTSASELQREMHELVGELRAEVTRLRAQEAKARAQSWIQRHPLLATTLSVVVGTATGYSVARVMQPGGHGSLSDHLRERLRTWTGEAKHAASRWGRHLGERAARSGAAVQDRAERAGRRLASEAQETGRTAQREARELARAATGRVRQAGADASEQIGEATGEARDRLQQQREKASEEVRELGETLEETASETLDDYGGSEESETGGGVFFRAFFTLVGIAAGGYLASLVRRWL